MSHGGMAYKERIVNVSWWVVVQPPPRFTKITQLDAGATCRRKQ